MRDIPGGFYDRDEPSSRQMRIATAWNAVRRVTTSVLAKLGVHVFSDPKYPEYEARKKEHGEKTEESVMAEYMFAMGVDEKGVKEKSLGHQKASAVKLAPHYRWLGELVFTYPANDFDDVMRGTDVITMFMKSNMDPDQETEDIAYPVAVDVKTDERDFNARVRDAWPYVLQAPASVYWVDTMKNNEEKGDIKRAEDGTIPASFHVPTAKGGKVQAMKLYAYIPTEDVAEYRRDKTTDAQAEAIMRRLGPYIRKQFQFQLEMMALAFVGGLPDLDELVQKRVSPKPVCTREQLMKNLRNYMASKDATQQQLKVETVINVLQRIWDEQAERKDPDKLKQSQPRLMHALSGLVSLDSQTMAAE